jgi:hypothetical protein
VVEDYYKYTGFCLLFIPLLAQLVNSMVFMVNKGNLLGILSNTFVSSKIFRICGKRAYGYLSFTNTNFFAFGH